MANTHPKLIEDVAVQTPKAMIAMLTVSSAFVIMFFKFIPTGSLVFWMCGQLLIAIGRIYNAKTFKKHLLTKDQKGLDRNEIFFILLNIIQAIGWTHSSILIMTYAPQPFELVSFVIAIGITTAAVLSMTSLYLGYLLFFLMMIIPQIMIMIYYGEHHHIALVIFTVIYIPSITMLSKSVLNSRVSHILAQEEVERCAIEFQRLSTIDTLTNIYNRRYFFEMAKTILLMATRERNNVSMLMLDIDHFKKVNDSYGHQAGDSVLVNLAKRIKSFMREGDLFARVGGEEFAILLNNTSLAQAEVLAERIRSTVECMELPYNEWSIKVTISIGLSEFSQDHTEIEQLYLKSDKNLYEGKIAGRNQCSSHMIQ